MPAPSPTGSAPSESSRASTAAPPATANGNGTKPAARRACEIETASAKWVNSVGHEHEREHGEEAAEHERAPAAARGRGRRAAPRRARARRPPRPAEHLRREPVAAVREDVELVPVVLERPGELVPGRVRPRRSRGRSAAARGRPSPRERDGGQGERRPPRAPSGRAAAGRRRSRRAGSARRARRSGGRARAPERATASVASPAHERSRDVARRRARSRRGRAAGGSTVAGSASAVYEPPCPAASAEHRHLGEQHREPAPGRAEHRLAGLPGDEERDRDEHGSPRAGRPGSGRRPPSRATSARNECQSGNA